MSPSEPAGPAVFVDKDGTLLEDVPYNPNPARMRLAPGAAEGLRLLGCSGYRIIVVSNQSGVARGRFPERALRPVADRLAELVVESGATLAGFEYCPHHPAGSVPRYSIGCQCRKPAPGLILRAAGAHGVDPSTAWMIGDILDDVEAGRRAGCRTILVDAGNETEWHLSPARTPDAVATDLHEAALIVLGRLPGRRLAAPAAEVPAAAPAEVPRWTVPEPGRSR